MGNNNGALTFLIIMMVAIFGSFVYFYIQFLPPPHNAVKCSNSDLTISFAIDDEAHSILMDGRLLHKNVIDIFSKAAISAHWTYKKETTKMLLDRVTGRLEIDTSYDGAEWKKDTLECVNASSRF